MAKIGERGMVKGERLAVAPLFISAKNKENIDELRTTLYNKVRELHVQKYPYNDFLYEVVSDEG
jgi:GTP-binding protein HflX